MNRKRSQLQAYFAGIIDGEGYIGIGFNGSTYGARVKIQMDDPHAIMMIAREYPNANVSYRKYPNNPDKRYWSLNLSHYNAYDFLKEIEPFLLVKREQAKVTLSFLVHRRREHAGRNGSSGKRNCTRCQRYLELVQRLKRVNKGVNSVELGELRQYRAKPEEATADKQFADSLMGDLWERVETSGADFASNKPISAPEQDIVHDSE